MTISAKEQELETLILKFECLHVFNTYKEIEETEETEKQYLECCECGEKRIEELNLESEETYTDIIKNGNKPSVEYEPEYNKKLLADMGITEIE